MPDHANGSVRDPHHIHRWGSALQGDAYASGLAAGGRSIDWSPHACSALRQCAQVPTTPEPNSRAAAARTAILAGATGLVGRSILEGLLVDGSIATVHALGRRKPAIDHPKLRAHVVDFAALPPLSPADDVYLALGTTIK